MEYTVTLDGNKLDLKYDATAKDATESSINYGYHPFYAVEDLSKVKLSGSDLKKY